MSPYLGDGNEMRNVEDFHWGQKIEPPIGETAPTTPTVKMPTRVSVIVMNKKMENKDWLWTKK